MWKRARCKEKKELRNIEITEACISLYRNEKFEDITISKIAKEANWTRSNFYKYYSTKEEAFLDVIIYLSEDWTKTLKEDIELKKELTPYSFASIWVESYEKNHIFTSLLCLSNSLMEEHSSLEKVVAFKSNLYNLMFEIVKILKEKTNAKEYNIHKFLISQGATIQGGYNFFKISDFKKKVLDELNKPINCNEMKDIIVENIELISKKYLF